MPQSDAFAPLRGRDFRLLFAGQSISIFGDGLLVVALAFAVQEITQSPAAIGIVLAAGIIPLVGLILVGGVWADRLRRNRLMLAADAVRAVTLATMATLLVTGVAEVWQLAVLNAIHGSAIAFFSPAATAIVPEVVRADHLQQANGLLGMTRSTAMIAGGALAGVLIDLVGPGVAVAIDSATFVMSGACLAAMRPRSRTPSPREPFLRELAGGWREVRSRRWVWMTILIFGLTLMLYIAPFEVVGPIVSKADYGGATVFGLVTAAIAVGVVAGNFLMVRGQISAPMVTCATLLLATAISPLLLAVVAPLWSLLPFYLVEGVAVGIMGATWTTALQRSIPEDRLSRVSAWDWMGSAAGLPLGYVLAGVFVEAVGSDAMLYSMSICAFVLAAWILASPAVRGIGRGPLPDRAMAQIPAVPAPTSASGERSPGGGLAIAVTLGAGVALLRRRSRRKRRARRAERRSTRRP